MNNLPCDIALCANKKCPIRKECLRGVDSNCERQVYAYFRIENKKCDFFIKKINERV